MTDPIFVLREQLLQLRRLHESGALDAAAYESSKAALERTLIDAVLAAAPAAPAAAAPAAATAAAAAVTAAPRAPATVWVVAAGVIVTLAALGYWSTGTPGEIGRAPAGFAEGGGADSAASHALDREQVEAMVARLAARLQEKPDDAEGWGMLGRSYMSLGRNDEALDAYGRALKIKPKDATLLADYADSLGVKNGRTLDGEPTQLIDRALQIEPDNLKALVLAGTAAFNRGDFEVAVKHWEHAVQVGPPGSGIVELARGGIAEARERGKLPVASNGATAAPAAAANPVATAIAGATVKGTVRLAATLKDKAGPEDTVFIFARPDDGSRMPLAIVRKQVKELPVEFTLDDSTSMSPATRLSGVKRVIVGARISKSGQAMPQPGDLEGLSAPVDVGATGVVVEIGTQRP